MPEHKHSVPICRRSPPRCEERDLTISRAPVVLAEREVRAERDAEETLKSAYRNFLKERDPSKKDKAGQALVRSIFGKDAIAEDPIL